MVEKWTLHSLATALVDISAVSMPTARSLNLRHLWNCFVWQLHFVGFYCPQHKVHLCFAVESASWYATPVRWMDYLVKGEMLTNRDGNKYAHNFREISFLCVWTFWGGSFISAHETWGQHFTCCLYIYIYISLGAYSFKALFFFTL